MIISLTKHNRNLLNKQQQDFFTKIVPLAIKIQKWTYFKASFLNIQCPRGFLPSITLADAILASNWGDHPISKPEYENKYSNNLSLMEAGEYWKGKTHEYEEKTYRAFSDWHSWGITYSDELTFSRSFDLALLCVKEDDQVKAYAFDKEHPNKYYHDIKSLISDYNLSEFNAIIV